MRGATKNFENFLKSSIFFSFTAEKCAFSPVPTNFCKQLKKEAVISTFAWYFYTIE